MALSLVFLGLVSSCLFFGPGVMAAFVAQWKGYRPWFWLLSAGPFGMLLILLKPSLHRATTPEERERWEQQADWAGGILSGFTMFCMFALPMLGMLAFYGVRSVRVPPAPIATPPIVTSTLAPVIEAMSDDSAPADSPSNAATVPTDSTEVRSPLEQPSAADRSK